nr:Mitochondrial substrate solute carrier [Echinococcus granulosus]
MIVTPFYAASIVEFVQSDIASEPTTLVSCLQEGLRRLLPNISPTVSRMGSVGGKLKAGLRAIPIRTSRLLPVWRLVLPVVVLGVGQHIIHSFVSFGVSAYLGRDQEPEQLDAEVAESCNIPDASSSSQKGIDGNDRTLLTSHRREKMLQAAYSLFTSDLTADFVASLTSEAILFPLETIAVRLCVQGTRTLVDNLDTGDSVIPIITSFDGPFDVLRHSSSSASGFIGLYRGFGALILQYAVQLAFLIGVKYAYERVLYYSSPTSTQPPPPPIGRSSMPSDYEPTNQHPSSFQSPFYSTVPNLLDHQPTTSVWQPNLDSERWRTSDPNLNSKNGAPLVPNRSSFVFRGYSPGPFDAPL